MVRSADAGSGTTPGALGLELPPFGSVEELLTATPFTIGPVAPGATSTSSVNVALPPFGSDGAVQVIVPFVRNAGVVHVNPAGGVMERKSSDDGRMSVSTTFAAPSG